MKVEIDDGPGLRLSELKRNGSDMLEAVRTLWEAQVISLGKLPVGMRFHPADATKEVEVDCCEGNKVRIEENWRMQYDPMSYKAWDEQEQQYVGWKMDNSTT